MKKTSRHCIDNIFTNIDHPWESVILENHASDHTAQKISFVINKPKQVMEFRRSFNEEARTTFTNRLREQNWENVFNVNHSGVDKQWKNFMTDFLSIFYECFQMKLIISISIYYSLIPSSGDP